MIFDVYWFIVYYETIKRELNKRLIYECRCDERRINKTERCTRLTYKSVPLHSMMHRWDLYGTGPTSTGRTCVGRCPLMTVVATCVHGNFGHRSYRPSSDVPSSSTRRCWTPQKKPCSSHVFSLCLTCWTSDILPRTRYHSSCGV